MEGIQLIYSLLHLTLLTTSQRISESEEINRIIGDILSKAEKKNAEPIKFSWNNRFTADGELSLHTDNYKEYKDTRSTNKETIFDESPEAFLRTEPRKTSPTLRLQDIIAELNKIHAKTAENYKNDDFKSTLEYYKTTKTHKANHSKKTRTRYKNKMTPPMGRLQKKSKSTEQTFARTVAAVTKPSNIVDDTRPLHNGAIYFKNNVPSGPHDRQFSESIFHQSKAPVQPSTKSSELKTTQESTETITQSSERTSTQEFDIAKTSTQDIENTSLQEHENPFTPDVSSTTNQEMGRTSSKEIESTSTQDIEKTSTQEIGTTSTQGIEKTSTQEFENTSTQDNEKSITPETGMTSTQEIEQSFSHDIYKSLTEKHENLFKPETTPIQEIKKASSPGMVKNPIQEIEKPSTTENVKTSTQEMERNSPTDIIETSTQEIVITSTQEFERATAPKIVNTSTPETEKSSVQDMEQKAIHEIVNTSTREILEASTQTVSDSFILNVSQPSTHEVFKAIHKIPYLFSNHLSTTDREDMHDNEKDILSEIDFKKLKSKFYYFDDEDDIDSMYEKFSTQKSISAKDWGTIDVIENVINSVPNYVTQKTSFADFTQSVSTEKLVAINEKTTAKSSDIKKKISNFMNSITADKPLDINGFVTEKYKEGKRISKSDDTAYALNPVHKESSQTLKTADIKRKAKTTIATNFRDLTDKYSMFKVMTITSPYVTEVTFPEEGHSTIVNHNTSSDLYLLVDHKDNLIKGFYALKSDAVNKTSTMSTTLRHRAKTQVTHETSTNTVRQSVAHTTTTETQAAIRNDIKYTKNKELSDLYKEIMELYASIKPENEEEKKNQKNKVVNWDRIRKFFGHDRVCNCKCRANRTMCKVCAASDAVIRELTFEFNNLANYMNDHCTEIQTFFWMNPSGGKKLRDAVHKIDKSMYDYYKRVKGKCAGRTCKTFATYLDKRNFDQQKKVDKTRLQDLLRELNQLPTYNKLNNVH